MGVDIDVQVDEGTVCMILTGEVDLANVVSVERQLHEAISQRTTEVVLDLAGVTYLDSAGLRVVLSLAERLRLAQIELRVVAPIGSAARFAIDVSGMTTICGLDQRPGG